MKPECYVAALPDSFYRSSLSPSSFSRESRLKSGLSFNHKNRVFED
jgi:hypothetical protein